MGRQSLVCGLVVLAVIAIVGLLIENDLKDATMHWLSINLLPR